MRIFSCLILAGLLLGGCGVRERLSRNIGTGETLAIYGLEGRWAGAVTPATDSCGSATTGLMSIGQGSFGFDPFQSTTVIQGKVAEGALDGTLTRPGPQHQTLSIHFSGRASRNGAGDEVITGTLESGRCRWDVALKRG